MPAAATVVRCPRRKTPTRPRPTLEAKRECSTAAAAPRALHGSEALRSRYGCRCRCRFSCRRRTPALFFLGCALCLFLLARDFLQHDLQPLAELRHDGQPPGVRGAGACAVVGCRSSSSCLALLPSVPVSSVPSQSAPVGMRFSTFGAAASTASMLLSAPLTGTGIPRGACVIAATLCQSIWLPDACSVFCRCAASARDSSFFCA